MLVISIFVGKIKLNLDYEKMTEKMHDKMLEKYKNSVFQILKIGKAFSHFNLNLTIGKKYTWFCNYLKIKSEKDLR